MSKERNKFINDMRKRDSEESNKEYYTKRIGKCVWKKCQSACCRFRSYGRIKIKGSFISKQLNYHDDNIVQKASNGYIFDLSPFLCPSITFEGKCVLHGKKEQSYVCTYFPMNKDDGMYIALKHICGYKFKKVKNKKYKRDKKKEEIEHALEKVE